MEEEEHFVNIDLNDDNICSICKLETDTGTLSFCHVCFELSIEGVCSATLLHSKSLRGHRDCFEKYHLIANQKLSRAKASHSAYEGVKRALSQRINRIIQYTQNRDSVTAETPGRWGAKQILCHTPQGGRKLVPQSDAQVPRYAPRWAEEVTMAESEYGKTMLDCHSAEELGLGLLQGSHQGLWAGERHHPREQQRDTARQRRHSREELVRMSVEELRQLNEQLLLQIQNVFEELSVAVQEKDSLSSELHVRHIAIEQLFKNCAKLPWLQIGRAGVKAGNNPVE
ncbi:protein EURL homolog [Sinocyclocheilus grahami]|uniref:protein EURL homolog n=1 Tax=Sinocyclocheilus grahami TaxID=75366 RepID=UPI0007AC5CF0|nr:PREDICTED: protein EURL homolog [Sinocyclocheilus grahami]XP_016132954.1 PREDICTED: protein EURL homolog [Sinocyclocheilus grahami]XP_016132961.1 PREDICTED: protein EURL homolog [Sinocyclocheilus grahami]XP_016132967.1 PREDICTED: protein EURL homolog [Sinocyclocheilus grahami]